MDHSKRQIPCKLKSIICSFLSKFLRRPQRCHNFRRHIMSSISLHNHTVSRNFTIVPNEIIDNWSLPMGARFLLIWMCWENTGYNFQEGALCSVIGVGRSELRRCVKELQDANLLHIETSPTGQAIWQWFTSPVDCQKLVETAAGYRS